MVDLGEGPGGRAPLLILDQTEAQRTEKNFLETGTPSSQDLDDRPPPRSFPYLDPPLVSNA